jgi:hypothetical protein
MKNKIKNFLFGRIVMVHPQLTTDPQSRQGETGIVVELKEDNEIATVKFKDCGKADYSIGGLLTLYPKDVMLQGVISNPEIGTSNQRLILKIQKLADEKRYAEALKLAMANDITVFHCITNCDHWTELMQERKRSNGRMKKL